MAAASGPPTTTTGTRAANFDNGLDILKIDDPLTDGASRVHSDILNVQTQQSYRERGWGRDYRH